MFLFLVLVLALCRVQAASAETHTLIHDGRVSSHSPDITVRAKLDGEEIGYYDSNKGVTPEQDWVKEEKYWDRSIRSAVPVLKTCKDAVRPGAEIRQQFGCGQSDDGKTSSFWNMTYKGQDFTLDRDSWSWTSEGQIPSDLPPEPNRRSAEKVLDQVCPECLKTLTRRRRAVVDKGEGANRRSHSPEPKSEGGFPIGIIVGVVVGVLVLIAVVGIVIWRKTQTEVKKPLSDPAPEVKKPLRDPAPEVKKPLSDPAPEVKVPLSDPAPGETELYRTASDSSSESSTGSAGSDGSQFPADASLLLSNRLSLDLRQAVLLQHPTRCERFQP